MPLSLVQESLQKIHLPFRHVNHLLYRLTAYLNQSTTSPNDVWIVGSDKSATKLTNLNPHISEWNLNPVEVVHWKNTQDGLDLDGLLVTPPGFKKGHRYPTMVQTHTGDIVRAIYNFQFDEMAQCGKPVVSPWLVKWKKVAPPKTVQRELPYFAVAQMAAIVKGAKTQLNRALFALAAGSGARAGELFALRVETDLNLDERMITIRRSVFEGEENTSKSDTGDEDRTRTVPIDASVVMELKKHLQGRRSGYLFETRNGTPLRLSNVLEDKLQPILRKLKLLQPRMGMHAFRRRRISHLVYSGVSRQVIRDWCGHSSDRMIDHYTKMLRQHHAPEMAKVKPLLRRSWTPVGPQLVERRVAR